jgi:hypothetical protein
MVPVTATPPAPERTPLPPDPAAYDSERNARARLKGLPQAYIAGGGDPELRETLERESRYVRLLVLMVAAIIALGFVLGTIGIILAQLVGPS